MFLFRLRVGLTRVLLLVGRLLFRLRVGLRRPGRRVVVVGRRVVLLVVVGLGVVILDGLGVVCRLKL